MNQILPGTARGSEGDDGLGNIERAFKQSLLDVKSEAQTVGKNVLDLIGKYNVEL